MISQEDKSVLKRFSARVRRHFPEARIWAFGSRVHGTANWDADFDICIVLDHVDKEIERRIRDIAWEVGFENDLVITTIVFNTYQFERGPISESTLVKNILQEGMTA